jgi:hypothetical protein
MNISEYSYNFVIFSENCKGTIITENFELIDYSIHFYEDYHDIDILHNVDETLEILEEENNNQTTSRRWADYSSDEENNNQTTSRRWADYSSDDDDEEQQEGINDTFNFESLAI